MCLCRSGGAVDPRIGRLSGYRVLVSATARAPKVVLSAAERLRRVDALVARVQASSNTLEGRFQSLVRSCRGHDKTQFPDYLPDVDDPLRLTVAHLREKYTALNGKVLQHAHSSAV